jgi:hypothetical protein
MKGYWYSQKKCVTYVPAQVLPMCLGRTQVRETGCGEEN